MQLSKREIPLKRAMKIPAFFAFSLKNRKKGGQRSHPNLRPRTARLISSPPAQ
jgi:hypothetical protein